MVRHGDRSAYFNLLSEGPDRDRRIDVLVNAARTFRTLSDAEAAALRPYRLRVVPPAGTSAAQLARRLPYGDYRMERLLRAERRRQCRRADAPAAGQDRRALGFDPLQRGAGGIERDHGRPIARHR